MLGLSKKKILYGGGILALCFVALFLFLFLGVSENSLKNTTTASILLKNFEPGTNVSYDVFSGDKLLTSGESTVDKKGVLKIQGDTVLKQSSSEDVTYKISMEKAKIDRMMDMTNPLNMEVKIDQRNKSATFSGSGLPELSAFSLIAGNKATTGKTDWSGQMNEQVSLGAMEGTANQMVKLAFQNMGMASDVDIMNPNTMEVFFGDDDGSSQGKVQERYSRALMMATEQLSAVMMQQALIIGTFLDAKMQMETQRKFQELQAQAHKDYHPSEQVCRFGTFVRSVANTEASAEHTKRYLNKYLMNAYLGVKDVSGAKGIGFYMADRLKTFVQNYCDPFDNNGALKELCKDELGATTPKKRDRYNKDIDYARTVDSKATLDINFTDVDVSEDEVDVVSLAQNLYFPQVFEKPEVDYLKYDLRGHYKSRSFAAKMGVAHNSFIQIVGMKSSALPANPTQSPLPDPPPQMLKPRASVPAVPNYTEDAGWIYMKALMREFGLPDENGDGSTDDEIHALLGQRPSYYAQMDVLTKKIYQSPDFYTNLYDKPANVERIGASVDAITIMNQRDRYESLLRQEMLTALLVEEALAPQVETVNARILDATKNFQANTR